VVINARMVGRDGHVQHNTRRNPRERYAAPVKSHTTRDFRQQCQIFSENVIAMARRGQALISGGCALGVAICALFAKQSRKGTESRNVQKLPSAYTESRNSSAKRWQPGQENARSIERQQSISPEPKHPTPAGSCEGKALNHNTALPDSD